MGVNGLFPRLSPACHPTDVIALLRPGLPIGGSGNGSSNGSGGNGSNSNKRKNRDGADTSTRPSKRRRKSESTSSSKSASVATAAGPAAPSADQLSGTSSTTTSKRRRVRVAVDISGWIARAAHGQGGHLLDDRLITNYGRAELAGRVSRPPASDMKGRMIRDGDGSGNGNGNGNDNGGGAGGKKGDDGNTGDTNNTENDPNNNDRAEQQQQQQEDNQSDQESSYQLGLRLDFISRCVSTVLRRVLTLRDECLADVLVVLDGASPPIKLDTVGDRRDRRDRAVAVRDARTGPISSTTDVAEVAAAAQAQVQAQAQAQGEGGGEGNVAAEAPTGPSESDRISAAKRAGASTSQIHYEVISAVLTALKSECIPFLVAPYEADGQLGYLASCGLVDLIVTEDTDLVGCGAPAILYKFSDWGLAGNGGGSARSASRGAGATSAAAVGGGGGGGVTGQLLLRSNLSSTPSPLNLMDFTDVMLSALFVAAGCDYCPSLKGVGVVTARKCVKEAFHGYGPGMLSCEADGDNPIRRKRTALNSRGRGEDGDDEPKLAKLFRLLYAAGYGGKRMTREERDEYEDSFCKALVMYRHPVVFDPIAAKCVVANDPTTGGADPELIAFEPYADIVNDPAKLQTIVGKVLDPARAALIAEGQINARSGKRFDEEGIQQSQQGQEQAESTVETALPTNAEPTNDVVALDDNATMLIDTGEEREAVHNEDRGEEEQGQRQTETAIAIARASTMPAPPEAPSPRDNAATPVDTMEDSEAEKAVESNHQQQRQGNDQPKEGSKEVATSKKEGPQKSNRCNFEGCNKYKQTGFKGMCRAHYRDSQKAAAAAAAGSLNTADVDSDEIQEILFESQPETQEQRLESPPATSEVGTDVAGEAQEELKQAAVPAPSRLCRVDGCNKRKQTDNDGMCRAHFKENQKEVAEHEDSNTTNKDTAADNNGSEEQSDPAVLVEPVKKSVEKSEVAVTATKKDARKPEVAADDDVSEDEKSDINLHLETQANLNLETQAESLHTAMGNDTVALSFAEYRPLPETQPELPNIAMDDGTTDGSASEQPLFETQAPFPEIQPQDGPSPLAAASAEENQQLPTDTPAKGKKESSGQTTLSSSSSKPLTQASSGSQAISSLSADPDALSPNLLEQTPPKADKVSGASPSSQQKSSVKKAAAKTARTPSSKSSTKKSKRSTPPQPQMGGIQGVLARLMSRR